MSILNQIEESAYTLGYYAECIDASPRSLVNWLSGKSKPSKKNAVKLEKITMFIKDDKKIPYHPAYGYATPEQIEKLNSMGMGPDRDHLLKQIAFQQANKGKIK